MAKPTPEYVIYNHADEAFVSPICSSIEALREEISDLDENADEDDYQIMTITRTVEVRLVKSGWTIERV